MTPFQYFLCSLSLQIGTFIILCGILLMFAILFVALLCHHLHLRHSLCCLYIYWHSISYFYFYWHSLSYFCIVCSLILIIFSFLCGTVWAISILFFGNTWQFIFLNNFHVFYNTILIFYVLIVSQFRHCIRFFVKPFAALIFWALSIFIVTRLGTFWIISISSFFS